MILRDYQQTLFSEIQSCLRDKIRNPLVCSPTGSGKTATFCYIAHRASNAGNEVLILVHRRELVTQTSATLSRFDVPHGIIMPGITPNPMARVQLAMVQTVSRRIEKIKKPALIIVDECHHCVSPTYANIIESFPRASVIGFSATPERLDGKGLKNHFSKIIMGPTVQWLIDNGHLVKPKYFSTPVVADLSGVKTRAGDYASDDLAERMCKPRVIGDAVEHYVKVCNNALAVAFCVNLKHAENTMHNFNSSGIPCGIIHGGQTNAERKQVVDDLSTGRIKVMTSVDVVSEGFDLPAAEVAILLRPTKSLGLHLQQIGRVLRPSKDKQAVVLDHVGNLFKHGTAEQAREWSLEDRDRKDGSGKGESNLYTQCEKCYCMYEKTEEACPECGFIKPVKVRKIDYTDGQLVEFDTIKTAPLKELLTKVRSRQELKKIAQIRGYKPGWAWHISKELGLTR